MKQITKLRTLANYLVTLGLGYLLLDRAYYQGVFIGYTYGVGTLSDRFSLGLKSGNAAGDYECFSIPDEYLLQIWVILILLSVRIISRSKWIEFLSVGIIVWLLDLFVRSANFDMSNFVSKAYCTEILPQTSANDATRLTLLVIFLLIQTLVALSFLIYRDRSKSPVSKLE
ncbi:MAG: hypothetical protein IPM21_05880 [Acidobacteria bacterium]|nr:hypothetical protein [Acidobacteriota bacterium]